MTDRTMTLEEKAHSICPRYASAIDIDIHVAGCTWAGHHRITAAVRAAEERGKRQVTQDVVDHEARCAVKLAEERMRERCAEEADDEGLVVLAANIRALPLTGDSDGQQACRGATNKTGVTGDGS